MTKPDETKPLKHAWRHPGDSRAPQVCIFCGCVRRKDSKHPPCPPECRKPGIYGADTPVDENVETFRPARPKKPGHRGNRKQGSGW